MEKKKRNKQEKLISLDLKSTHNPFVEEHNSRVGLGKLRLPVILALILFALMVASLVFRYDYLHYTISAARIFSAAKERLNELWSLISGKGNINGALYSICTVVIAALVGAWLAVCGTVYQGVFRTPMASPSMLGIQSGGMVAAVLYLFFCWESGPSEQYFTYEEYKAYLNSLSFYETYAQQLWILAGCILGAALVISISNRAGKSKFSPVVLILAGSLLNAFANAIVSLGQYYFTYVDPTTDRTYALMSISMGTFANVYTPRMLVTLGAPLVLAVAVVIKLAPGLNLLIMGDDEARSMGMKVTRFRTIVFLACIIPNAMILASCGQISFVGLIIPHFSRHIAGSDYQKNLPASALLGAISMVLVYHISVCTGYTTSINLITSIAGGGIFLILLLRYRRGRNADWA